MSTNEAISRLDAVVQALADVNVADWPDSTLSGHLEELSIVLCAVDGQLTRLAESIRERGYRVSEPQAAAA